MATENIPMTKPASRLTLAWRGFWKGTRELGELILSSPTAVIGLVVVLAWVFVAIFAPLITTYSPLRHWGVGKYHKLAVVGLGGLGHMAVKIATALGTEVTVLSTSERKRQDAERLGAKDFALSSQRDTFTRLQRHFDFILDTASAPHNYNSYVNLLKTDGTMILVGAPEKPTLLEPFPLIMHRRRIAGSVIGGIRETQEMLDFCAEHHIESEIELIPIQQVNEAYERVVKGDVRFRFVIDLASLA